MDIMVPAAYFSSLIFACVAGTAPALTAASSADDEVVVVGSTTVHLLTTNLGEGGPLYINLHENESTSVAAARALPGHCSGTIVRLVSNGKREISFKQGSRVYTVDPNRIFTDQGLRQNLSKYNGAGVFPAAEVEVRKLREAVLRIVERNPGALVALHNNARRQSFSFDSYENGNLQNEAKWARRAPLQAGSEFFLVTRSSTGERLYAQGFSTVLQSKEADDDGSLSIWSQRHGRDYINVEAWSGAFMRQRNMLSKVCDLYR